MPPGPHTGAGAEGAPHGVRDADSGARSGGPRGGAFSRGAKRGVGPGKRRRAIRATPPGGISARAR
ncbi:hypothetical protein AQ876_31250 [Burkholderia pseudomallei]|nr:hypothetical protein AQ861_12175 [Burkholderia pseudomallei]ONA13013.1 hypothetical protein AQ876_31250 [Burkholderia pseudomallei]ROZ99669.1 hypothetical protein EGT86_22510 [Burkholderia pseudomallei]